MVSFWLKPFKPPDTLVFKKVFHLLIHFSYDLRNSRTAVGLTELVNHSFIKKAAMSAKKKVPAVLKHYEVPQTLPAKNFKAKCKYCAKEITGSVRATTNWWKHMVRILFCCCIHPF